MRISTSWNHQLGVNAMLDQQAKLSDTQLKLSTGKQILSPAEDPAAAVRLMDLEQMTKQTEQYQGNIDMIRQRLALEETNIKDVVDTMFRIRTLTVQGKNDTNTQSDRAAIAAEIDQLNEHLLGIANTKNANGEYIFAGYATDITPFQKGPQFDQQAYPFQGEPPFSYPYYGDRSQRNIQIGPSRQVADGNWGEQVFGTNLLPADIDLTDPTQPKLDPSASPQNLFEIVSKVAALLRDNSPKEVVSTVNGSDWTALDQGLNELDVALERVVAVETTVGARMNVLDRQESINDDYILDLKSVTSDTGDLDYAQAISKFNLQQTSLQAAQQAYTKVHNLSLFNYL